MKITDLMPIGPRKDRCATLQARTEGTVRTVYWTSEAPDYVKNGQAPAQPMYICNITEENIDVIEFPEVMCEALAEVLLEIFENPNNLEKWKPGSFNRMLHRAETVSSLKNIVTKDDYIKALQTKSRLGIWLERGEP